MADALRIAILGAECTGKSALSQALGAHLSNATRCRVVVVSEWLRDWCVAAGRTPQAHEQRGIAEEQQRRIEAAALSHDIVICDTTPVMTAAYSRWYFADAALDCWALAEHSRCQVTLLMGLDLPWQADGIQRDGEHVRAPVDALLRELLARPPLPFHCIGGTGTQRLQAVLKALQPWLARLDIASANQGPKTTGTRGAVQR